MLYPKHLNFGKNNNYKMNTLLEEVKKVWSRYPLLEINGYTHNPEKSIKDFIEEVFLVHNESLNSVTIKKKSKNTVSHFGSKRSFVDMWGLCRNYYKGCSLEEVCKAMFDLVKEEKIYGNWFCETVKRYVFSPHKNEYEDTNLRKARILLNKYDSNIYKLAEELGYKEEDFKRKKTEPAPVKKGLFSSGSNTLISTSTFYWR